MTAVSHKVFISHSSKDAFIANAICHRLEQNGIRCWLAPRDIDSTDWAGSIIKGLHSCDVFVVIISHNSIPSPEVTKEITEATRCCQYILPFKVDNEMLSDRLRYHLAPCHWLDAVTPPLEAHIEKLKNRISNLSDDDNVFLNRNCQHIRHTPSLPKSFFVGRDSEIEQIHDLLEQEHVLFLQGMGGIGKSEIAKGYAKKYADSYNTVVFTNYRGSLLDLIIGEDIEIVNFKRNTSYGQDAESAESYFKRKLKTLKELSDYRTLLIVDNFDVLDDEHLAEFIDGPYKVLFTTRYEHPDYPSLQVGPIADFDTVRQLFAKNYGRAVAPKDKATVDSILRLVNCHTITVELVAKQMRASFTPPGKMLRLLRDGGMNAGLKEGIQRGSKKTAFDFISDLFNLASLSSEEQQIMRYMCLVPFSGIEAPLFGQCINLEDFNIINDLVAKSWLILDEESYKLKMHPIIYDVVRSRLAPDLENCHDYVYGLWKNVSGAWNMTVDEREEIWPLVDCVLKKFRHPTPALFAQFESFANIAWICGQFPQSVEAGKNLYDYTLKQFGDVGFYPGMAARCIGGAYSNGGDYTSAEPYYYLALNHQLAGEVTNFKEMGIIYTRVADCAIRGGRFEEAADCLDKAYEWLCKVPPELADVGDNTGNCIANVAVHRSHMHMAMQNWDKAIKFAEKAYNEFLLFRGEEINSSSVPLTNLGICCSMLGQYKKAEEYLNRALQLNIRFNGEASIVTVRSRESIADNLAREGRIDEARKAYIELELETEKNFGSECPLVLQLKEKSSRL